MNRLPTRGIRIRQREIEQVWPRVEESNLRGCVFRNALKYIRCEHRSEFSTRIQPE